VQHPKLCSLLWALVHCMACKCGGYATASASEVLDSSTCGSTVCVHFSLPTIISFTQSSVRISCHCTKNLYCSTKDLWWYNRRDTLVSYKQSVMCYLLLTAQKYCSPQNIQTVLWHHLGQETTEPSVVKDINRTQCTEIHVRRGMK
jgi:hypothetical protein